MPKVLPAMLFLANMAGRVALKKGGTAIAKQAAKKTVKTGARKGIDLTSKARKAREAARLAAKKQPKPKTANTRTGVGRGGKGAQGKKQLKKLESKESKAQNRQKAKEKRSMEDIKREGLRQREKAKQKEQELKNFEKETGIDLSMGSEIIRDTNFAIKVFS